MDALPRLPEPGDYLVRGTHGATGEELFSISFEMPDVPDGYPVFAFAIPLTWTTEDLGTIVLSGPDGSDVLDAGTNRPMAILMDAGQVRAILRDVEAERYDGHPDWMFSRGVPR